MALRPDAAAVLPESGASVAELSGSACFRHVSHASNSPEHSMQMATIAGNTCGPRASPTCSFSKLIAARR